MLNNNYNLYNYSKEKWRPVGNLNLECRRSCSPAFLCLSNCFRCSSASLGEKDEKTCDLLSGGVSDDTFMQC